MARSMASAERRQRSFSRKGYLSASRCAKRKRGGKDTTRYCDAYAAE